MKQDLGTAHTGEESERQGRYVETYRPKATHRRARKTKRPLLRKSTSSIISFSFQSISLPPCPAPAPTPCMNDQLISLSLHVQKSVQNVGK